MGFYTVVYRGPSSDEDPKLAGRIAEAVAARWPLSEDEALRRLSRTPFALCSGLSREQALLYVNFLKGFGANVEVASYQAVDVGRFSEEGAESVAPARQWFLRHAWRGALSALASGLSLSSVIVVAGMVLIALAPYIAGPDTRPEPFSAIGWIAVGLGLLIFFGIVILRLKELVRIVSPPDLSTPIKALQSNMRAICERNWGKALRCLARRSGSRDLGSRPREAVLGYFKALSRSWTLPRVIDPALVTLFYCSDGAVVLRFQIEVISRRPASDGTYLRRVFVDSRRFLRLNGQWFLLDGYFLGQTDPARLPIPACPECGVDSEFGRMQCESCGEDFPALALIEESWQPARRKPDLAALMSALVPGLGQAYNGQLLKGLLIAATCWTVLPWVVGVVDAMRTAERINRNVAYHDLSSRPFMPVAVHLLVFISAVIMVFTFAHELPLLGTILQKSTSESHSDLNIFSEPEGRFSVLFPSDWVVRQEDDELGRLVVLAISADGNSSVRISSRRLPQNWQPCQHAQEARNKLEGQGANVESFRCGFIKEHLGYRLDSYSSDRRWRRSLIVVAVGEELIDTTFACPRVRQAEIMPIFERVVDSLQFSEQSRIN